MEDTDFEDSRMEVRFGGLTQQGDEATNFLLLAMVGALFLMFIILVTQFNSISWPIIILMSVIFQLLESSWDLLFHRLSPQQ